MAEPTFAINRVFDYFSTNAKVIDKTDGICMQFSDWRFNLRSINIEQVFSLNVELRSVRALMRRKTEQVLALLLEK